MKIITPEKNLIPVIESIVDNYKAFTDLKISKELKIVVSHNINIDFLIYSANKDKKEMQGSDLSFLNGMLILPRDEVRDFTIIINRKQFNTDDYIHTLYHELTHYSDYINYFEKFGNVYEQNELIRIQKYFYEFGLWSEYHAKKIGNLLFYFSLCISQYGSVPKNWKEIIEVGFQSDVLVKNINILKEKILTNKMAMKDFLNFLFGYYGRLSIFQKENKKYPNDDFPEKELLQTFGNPIIDIYSLLLKSVNYQKAIENISKMKRILDEICVGFNKKNA